MQLLIGTDAGLFELRSNAAHPIGDGRVSHLATGRDGDWAIIDDQVVRLGGAVLTLPDGRKPRCLLPTADGLLVGTSEAHLYLARDGRPPELVVGFAEATGRAAWHTPWGGPPDTRSLARDADGTLYANVHVGGVLRSTDRDTWTPTMDIAADVHQVSAHPTLAGCVLVASAWGLGTSLDGADSWKFTLDGLHNAYARAVVAAGETVLISASDGPRGGRGALYRRPLRSGEPLEKCRAGLPEWVEGNIDSGCLIASGAEVAFGTAGGSVFVSTDAGANWSTSATGLPPIRALALRSL